MDARAKISKLFSSATAALNNAATGTGTGTGGSAAAETTTAQPLQSIKPYNLIGYTQSSQRSSSSSNQKHSASLTASSANQHGTSNSQRPSPLTTVLTQNAVQQNAASSPVRARLTLGGTTSKQNMHSSSPHSRIWSPTGATSPCQVSPSDEQCYRRTLADASSDPTGGSTIVTRRLEDGHLDVRFVYSRDFILAASSSPYALVPPSNVKKIVAEMGEIIAPFPTSFFNSLKKDTFRCDDSNELLSTDSVSVNPESVQLQAQH
ncbi:unnamed protein product [Anisakis simplex]|uniref:SH2 domain-containing protein n=1 Tax=Anisakis simplex TaxID=6269 RepID=A0A0M3KCM1_ANISI|nr:unnamed protein product [Anisakis simplex]